MKVRSRKPRSLYTTSEYVVALEIQSDGNLYARTNDFQFFANREAGEYDAQWLVDHYKKEGKKVRKPRVYRVRLEEVK